MILFDPFYGFRDSILSNIIKLCIQDFHHRQSSTKERERERERERVCECVCVCVGDMFGSQHCLDRKETGSDILKMPADPA